MNSLVPLITVAMLWMLAAMTPGPNFLVTVRVAVTQSRNASLRTVVGIGLGTFVWGLAGFLGIHALFVTVPWVYLALKLAGGAYLVWLGWKLAWHSFAVVSERKSAAGSAVRGWASFRLGLITNLSNPKTAVFVTGLFAAAMPNGARLSKGLAAVALMTAISLGWYSLVALLFTSARVADGYARGRRWIDRLAGACFMFFGGRLLAGAA